MSSNKIRLDQIINFNPSRIIKKGISAPFVEMAGIPEGNRDISYTFQKEFNGSGSKFRNGDTLFARITPCLENGKTAKVNCLKKNEVGHGSTEFIVFSAKEPAFDEDFIYYLCRWPKFREFAKSRMEGTSGRQRVDWKVLAESEWELPEKEERKEIGFLLKQIDDKISNNNRINQTLEEIAQALFKSWFVDFEPVKAKMQNKAEGTNIQRAAMCSISGKTEEELQQLPKEKYNQLAFTADLFPDDLVESELGLIPEGWKVSEISKEVSVFGGATPSTKNNDFWVDGTNYWTTPKDLSGLKDKILIDTQRKITSLGVREISSGVLPKNTVLLSSRAPVGYLVMSKIPISINQGFIAMVCKKKLPPEYIVQWLDSAMPEIKSRASGTTFLEISKKNFNPIKIIVPTKFIIETYLKKAKPIYDLIEKNIKQSKILAEQRDILLPKLLSGDILFDEI